jgi:RNA polymerase sigma-70 factor (ECF subfamily)
MTSSQEEFDLLLESVESGLKKFIQRHTYSDIDAGIVMQKTLERAYKKFDQFERGTNFRAWIYKIAYTTFVNHYYVKKKNPIFVYDDSFCEDAIPGLPIHDVLKDNEDEEEGQIDKSLVSEAFQDLPEEQQRMIHYYYNLDMKYREIAEVLDIPIGTVMSRLNRAKTRIRNYIEGSRLQ